MAYKLINAIRGWWDKLVGCTFIIDIDESDDDEAITKAIITLVKALNLNTITGGVEQKEQSDFLTA